jgi:anti-sigma-K factor RskA
MNYGDPSLREHLAAEYALGTLRGRARRRFERLMANDRALRDLVAEWETRLNPLAAAAAPVAPPPALWHRIEAQLGAPADQRAAPRRPWLERLFGPPAVPIPTAATAGLWYCVGFWRAAAIAMAAAAVALAIHVATLPPAAAPSHIAVLAGEDAKPVLLARLDAASGRLELTPIGLPAPAPDASLELWLLPPQGAPRSLGLVGRAGLIRELSAADADSLAHGALAISLEPAGGSPTGQPTGPVLYQGPVVPASPSIS